MTRRQTYRQGKCTGSKETRLHAHMLGNIKLATVCMQWADQLTGNMQANDHLISVLYRDNKIYVILVQITDMQAVK